MDSKDRRTSSSINGDLNSQPAGTQALMGLTNVEGTVHHYELPNLA